MLHKVCYIHITQPEYQMENTNRRDETTKQNAAEADCTTTTN